MVVCCGLGVWRGVLAQYYLQEVSSHSDVKDSVAKLGHRPLCKAVRRITQLKDEDFDYMPTTYMEYLCGKQENSDVISKETQMCTFPGFECVQRNRSIMLAKRRKGTELWEFYKQPIFSDCDCMLPVMDFPSGKFEIR